MLMQDDGDPSKPRARTGGASVWWKLLPLSAILVAGAAYFTILRVDWTRLFRSTETSSFEVVAVRGSVLDPVHDGDMLVPGQPVRFTLQSSKATHVTVIALSTDRTAALLVPSAAGQPAPLIEAGKPVTLETVAHVPPQKSVKYLAVLCHADLSPQVIRKAGERTVNAMHGPEYVRTLDLGCTEHEVLVHTDFK